MRWGEHRGVGKTIEELKSRGAKRVGLIGPLVAAKRHALAKEFDVVLLLDGDYVGLRLVKSEEEIEWLRKGAALSDAGFQALLEGIKPGMNERALANLVERAYVGEGGTTIHYIGVTSMRDPHICVPPQFPSERETKVGDVRVLRAVRLVVGLCGSGTAQLHRRCGRRQRSIASFTRQPRRRSTRLRRPVKPGATAKDLLEASRVIEDRGFTICDDLVHGFGGGYFPPIIGSISRPAGPLPDFTLEEKYDHRGSAGMW